MNERVNVMRNDVIGKSHWLKVKLIGVKSNRSAIGEVRLQNSRAAQGRVPLYS